MLKKIISGGQTGADQAALDVAMKMEIPHGGWIPKGRKTEKGPLPNRYLLQELPSQRYADRTEKNVIDSDGTLILSHGPLTGGSKLTEHQARTHRRPLLHVDLLETIAFQAAKQVSAWIKEHGIEVLNVAGPRESNDPRIYRAVYDVLQTAVYMSLINEVEPDKMMRPFQRLDAGRSGYGPKTIDQAVRRLLNGLTFQEKSRIANLSEKRLADLRTSLGSHIVEVFGLGMGNHDLLDACRQRAGDPELQPLDATHIIIQHLWHKLKAHTNLVRLVK